MNRSSLIFSLFIYHMLDAKIYLFFLFPQYISYYSSILYCIFLYRERVTNTLWRSLYFSFNSNSRLSCTLCTVVGEVDFYIFIWIFNTKHVLFYWLGNSKVKEKSVFCILYSLPKIKKSLNKVQNSFSPKGRVSTKINFVGISIRIPIKINFDFRWN
jgi:hypothetical protein